MKYAIAAATIALSIAGTAAAADLPDAVTLGAAVQMTGAIANTGRYYRDAYQIAVDKINEKGGAKVSGKALPLELKLLDNQSDVNLGVRQYVELVTREKVNFLLGPYSSNDVLDTSSVAEKYQIPMVQGGGASTQIYSRGYKFIFGTLPAADDYFASTVRMLKEIEPKAKTVALIAADDAFDTSLAKGTRKLLQENGLDIVLDQTYPGRSSDFSSILAQVKAKEPDVVLWGGLEPEVLNAIRQAKSLDANAKLMYSFTVGVPTADLRKALGGDAEDAFGMTAWLPAADLQDEWFGDAAQFAKAYKEKFGYEPDYHAAAAVAAVEALVKAIQNAGTLEPLAVRDALAKTEFDSLYAHVRFGGTGQVSVPQFVIQIQKGDVVEIFTDHVVNKPVFPVPPWNKRG